MDGWLKEWVNTPFPLFFSLLLAVSDTAVDTDDVVAAVAAAAAAAAAVATDNDDAVTALTT